jgi:5-methylcytosine-specific restriction endonuclease McrA|tara:strand:+ start:2022 stop:2315 length:294 start_codon:yes stop_codon:yes gene_type:complete
MTKRKLGKNKEVRQAKWDECKGICPICFRTMLFESIGSHAPWETPHPHHYVNGYKSIVFSLDHIYPISRGGADTLDNLQGMCITCNKKKHNKVDDNE